MELKSVVAGAMVLSWTLHCALMEELKMNRSEIFNFALRRCLYFS